jgi:hypothetical protein
VSPRAPLSIDVVDSTVHGGGAFGGAALAEGCALGEFAAKEPADVTALGVADGVAVLSDFGLSSLHPAINANGNATSSNRDLCIMVAQDTRTLTRGEAP